MNMSVSFGVWLVGAIILIMSVAVVCMIREPILKNKKD